MPNIARAKYESILHAIPGRPLYAESWWLDVTCGSENWDVYFFTDAEGNEIGCLPYYTTKVASLEAVITPPMTQWLGLVGVKDFTSINLQDFIDAIKSSRIVDISLKAGSETTYTQNKAPANLKYSYVISVHSDIQLVRSNYNEGLRRNIKEAEKKYTIVESNDVNELINLSKGSYLQRNVKTPSWVSGITPHVYDALDKHKRGRLTFALEDNKPIAAIMTGWDERTEYYLLGGRSESTGASAHALLLDDAISHAISSARRFDFEGSMHPGIANFFQSFGAIPEPYLQIRKYTGMGKLWALLH